MLKTVTDKPEIVFILNNLRKEDKAELIALYGKNWFPETLKNLENDLSFPVLYGFDKNKRLVPVAMGGFYEPYEQNKTICCVWLLTTKYAVQNKSLFFKNVKNQIKQASLKYEIMYNFIYKSNYEAKKWLKKYGFKFDKPNPKELKVKDGFEFFYKINKKGKEGNVYNINCSNDCRNGNNYDGGCYTTSTNTKSDK